MSNSFHGGRYILPTIEERTNQGTKFTDPYSKLFEARIIFISAPIDATSSGDVVAQLLSLDHMSSEDISLYIHSPGGDVAAAKLIIDTIALLKSDVATLAMGNVSEVASLIVAAGAKGKRSALPNSRLVLLQPMVYSQGSTQQTDLELLVRRGEADRDWMIDFLVRRTGQPREVIASDIEREFDLSAQEAFEYGLIDDVKADMKD